ncbi:carboxypeptidase-like regulatory domain-containing protein [Marinilabilia salmonicolor]|uniref:carboxypeptidase-like regulatory domain-containing protein n=1 Tax=Marinilabilia salmonicolor TaxID=989 RepID=UPI00029A1597|nr:carboxypeptidase-like regulatory domain-containing protein [Marinilabilia salmonicolor]
MKIIILMITGCCLLFAQTLQAQDKNKITASGTLYNKENQKPLGYVQLVSYNTYLSYTSDSNGQFRISLPADDSIRIVSMGFDPRTIKATDFRNSNINDSIFLSPASYMLNEVIVRAEEREMRLNLPGNFGINVDPDAEPDKSIPSPSIGMVMSPLSLAHSLFSKEAKSQRKTRKVINSMNQKSAWEEVISSGMLNDWIEIKDQEMEPFIIFCNQRLKMSKQDNLLTIRNKILRLWEEYKQTKQ